jgi:hypothetical protein
MVGVFVTPVMSLLMLSSKLAQRMTVLSIVSLWCTLAVEAMKHVTLLVSVLIQPLTATRRAAEVVVQSVHPLVFVSATL